MIALRGDGREGTIVEMLNIVGERERPNLGFARDVRAA